MGRPSKGRQRIEIRLIKDADRLEVTFSKRKSGLLKKASELSLLCGAHVAFVVFSPGGRAFALGTPSVDHVLRRFDPLPGDEDGDGVSAIADRGAVEAIVRRTEETKSRVEAEKVRMDAVGEKVRQAMTKAGGKFWWEADVEALGEAELPEFARALRRLRDNVQRHVDLMLASA
ncbi:hypothetical protein HU200_062936 [Digitaria exilis]|uniref:MADS-box domain-containing protein n=1 Tax=Digitaria exilis TaxID=1010633 RepID=A0A835A7X5_9POAL|nr:hypothetical protein HU200_062936 [Digitaria exilis]